MASRNETTREFTQDFLAVLCGIFFFKEFYQPDGSQQQLPEQQHVEAVFQRCFADLPFFIKHLWWLFLNMKFRHQH